MKKYGLIIMGLMVMAAFASKAYATETPYELEWVRQLGTSSSDDSRSVAIDSLGNAYISGQTWGDLGGPNAGYSDAFLAKYDASGALLWMQQLGTSSRDESNSVAIDASGNAYISGCTLGSDHNDPRDAFLAKFDASGAFLWTRQLGTSSIDDQSHSVAIDGSGNPYISGHTRGSLGGPNAGWGDAFLAKYDDSGTLLWTQQLGTSVWDVSNSVAIDGSGNAYISGSTQGSLGGPNAGSQDAFLAKYDSSGALLWTRQLGTSTADISRSLAVDDSGNAYISGCTWGSLGGPAAGEYDAFLAKYDAAGALLWTRQLGTSIVDYSYSVAVDGSGNAYISGYTGYHTPDYDYDAFLAKYDASGTFLWTRQLSSSEGYSVDRSYSVAVDGSGNAYISGETAGSLGGPNAGGDDAFIAKYSPAGEIIPEPGTLALFAPALLAFAGIAARRLRK